MHIAAAITEDATELATVHVRSWQAAYAGILDAAFLDSLSIDQRAEQWRGILQQQASRTLVARQPEGMAGFVSFGHWRDEAEALDHGEVWALYAGPEAWGKGVGRRLLEAAVGALRAEGRHTVSLWVLSRNERAIRFYQAFGFRPVEGSAKAFELGGARVEEVCLRLELGAALPSGHDPHRRAPPEPR